MRPHRQTLIRSMSSDQAHKVDISARADDVISKPTHQRTVMMQEIPVYAEPALDTDVGRLCKNADRCLVTGWMDGGVGEAVHNTIPGFFSSAFPAPCSTPCFVRQTGGKLAARPPDPGGPH
ncbi:hypothetical protein BaRGS_00019096 [Batillaria attramentaria]|uniref:Uncharacterized protein n=1 Tax=Batillaria attramentaria TaxID=370345 RepID=A0ABD0KQY3_9CAEN